MSVSLHMGDCLEVMRGMADNSVDLVCTDPPYYRVKGEAWDRQWDNREAFLEWMRLLVDEWHRILRPNGSLYVFASPQMSARVECLVGDMFKVLSSITWVKPDPNSNINRGAGRGGQACKEALRQWFPIQERIIFAEHYGADNIAKGEAGYEAKCDQLRGFLFEPIRAYLDDERIKAGLTPEDCNEICGHRREGGMAGRHYFSPSQWCLPTPDNYSKLQAATGHFNRQYEDLRRQYEDLRRQYEDLRRPFSVSADVPYTDVWDFPTVSSYPGKHVCEKPAALIRHIVRSSSRPGAVVFDGFMGSGVVGQVCMEEGRNFIGCDTDELWVKRAAHRIERVQSEHKQAELITA